MDDNTLKTPRTTFDIIEILDQTDGTSLSAIAETLDRPVSTVHGHLKTLEEKGYVIQDGQTYHLSLKFLNIGYNLLVSKTAYKLGRRFTDTLAEETGERAIFAVEENGVGVYIACSSGENPEWPHETVGSQFPLHTAAAGKVLMASFSEDRVREIVEEVGLPKRTEFSINSKESLCEELERVRSDGIAFNREEHIRGLKAAATGVRNEEGEVVGALAVSVAADEVDQEWLNSSLPSILRETAADFETALHE